MNKNLVTVTGPFWSAKVEIVELAAPQQDRAWRTLFLDRNPRDAKKLLLPGTILALGSPREVRLTPGQEAAREYTWQRSGNPPAVTGDNLKTLLDNGSLALLLLQTDPEARTWPAALGEAVCLAGEINLEAMAATGDAVADLYAKLGLMDVRQLDVGQPLLVNGDFESPDRSPHPLDRKNTHPVGNDSVPFGWQVFRFRYKDKDYEIPDQGWQHSEARNKALDNPGPWALPRLNEPSQDRHALSGRSFHIYGDEWPIYIQVGQRFNRPGHPKLGPGRYLFSISVLPRSWGVEGRRNKRFEDDTPPENPNTSLVTLFAGPRENPKKTDTFDATQVKYKEWSRRELEFEVVDDQEIRVGVILEGQDELNRHGWYLDQAELVRVDAPEPEPIPKPVLTVHASGLSIYGAATFPWDPESLPRSAPFLLYRPPVNLDQEPADHLRLVIETERLADRESRSLIRIWQALGRYLTPTHPLLTGTLDGQTPSIPHWVTLEIANPLVVPQLFWKIRIWGQPELRFKKGEINLLLTDRQPYDRQRPPTSIARVATQVLVEKQGERLTLQLGQPLTEPALSYNWQKAGDKDSMQLDRAAELAFDPVETARFLRRAQGLPAPEWSNADGEDPQAARALETAVLWGFMPLADGWAQLPVPNLTEQIYLDAKVARFPDATDDPNVPLLEGAVTFDNIDNTTLRQPEDEQPWSVTLVNARAVYGTWTLEKPGNQSYQLQQVSLSFAGPELIVNGLLWLSTGRSTTADALPNLDDWITGLRSVSLVTAAPQTDLFPAPLTIRLDPFSFERRATAGAKLRSWSWQYQPEPAVLTEMVRKKILPAAVLSQYTPLIWRRHPRLPMIQALPLTQTQSPPNHPSASRQLVPFAPVTPTHGVGEVEDETIELPGGWTFGVTGQDTNGANHWPVCVDPLQPASEWMDHGDLPLVALSLPGLILDPQIDTSITDEHLKLPWQYRFDLPYLDEVNALAQLPKVPPDAEKKTVLRPEEGPPKPDEVLTRDLYARRWRQLAELAALASADAVTAFVRQENQMLVRFLIEPYDWPIARPEVDEQYPGTLKLTDAASNDTYILTAKEAEDHAEPLAGISGRFALDDKGNLSLANGSSAADSFVITAGSMAAHPSGQMRRDQRGLARSASRADDQFVRTTVQRLTDKVGTSDTVELTTTRQPVELHLGAADESPTWQLWFRDAPFRSGRFDRDQLLSPAVEDVNDPNALSLAHDYLTGYEWRLAPQTEMPGGPLLLHHLHFYPLRLEQLVEDEGLKAVQFLGRLQLPLSSLEKAVELADLDNTVYVTFFRQADSNGRLTLVDISINKKKISSDGDWVEEADSTLSKPQASTAGEWPLAMVAGELTDAPRLLWSSVRLDRNATSPTIVIENVSLQFFLFGERWSIPFPELSFNATTVTRFYENQVGQQLRFKSVELNLNTEDAKHTIDLQLGLKLGRQSNGTAAPDDSGRVAFTATVKATYTSTADDTWTFDTLSAKLFDDIQIQRDDPPRRNDSFRLLFADNTFQFGWDHYIPDAGQNAAPSLQLLPGMHLNGTKPQAPGFAALSFTATSNPADRAADGAILPTLILDTAFVEAILFAQWGGFLQEKEQPAEKKAQIFGSSAGDLILGYTANWEPGTTMTEPGTWQEGFLLNGFLEVKNLISWPKGLAHAEDDPTTWTLPAARASTTDTFPPLTHLRHTIRILFNQHQIPAEILVMRSGDLLFDLDDRVAWQFLAVVEHQLIEVDLESGLQDPKLTNDQRWTTLQEVRLLSPTYFKQSLAALEGHRTVVPWKADGPVALDKAFGGYYRADIKNLLTETLDTLPEESLVVEASAPHWVNQAAAAVASPTALQYLPTGTQTAILSDPDDFRPSDPHDPEWLLLTMPFLGRLQHTIQDNLAPLESNSARSSRNPLQTDPIVFLQRGGNGDGQEAEFLPLALALTHWANKEPVEMQISAFDTLIGRSFARLDTLSLQENWLRLQNPLPEPLPDRLSSVMAALPDSPARLSRATALRRAFDAFRRDQLPPVLALSPEAPPRLEWQRDSLLALPEVGQQTGESSAVLPGWPLTGLHLKASSLAKPAPAGESGPMRHAAATLIPALLKENGRDNPQPVSFAVSPYLGLAYRASPASDAAELRLLSTELLCLEPTSGQLRPVASRLWTRELFRFRLDHPVDSSGDVAASLREAFKANRLELSAEAKIKADSNGGWLLTDTTTRHYDIQESDGKLVVYWSLDSLDKLSKAWASDSRRRLSPDSPLAIIRRREIREHPAASADEAALITTYRFIILDSPPASASTLTRRVFRLRTDIAQLHFREGQFGGAQLPTRFVTAETDGSEPQPLPTFQLAPPQTVGVQPIRALERPLQASNGMTWPWGWSGLRLGLHYTAGQQGIVGQVPNGASVPVTLWWQAIQQRVQFRPDVAGLPKLFRAAAITSLLPVLPHPPLPMDLWPLLEATAEDEASPWQPVLPGSLRYLLLGARPGVMLAIRSQLLSQRLASESDGAGEAMVSGSMPVQHRVPRPVPLPRNSADRRGVALQTWASYFEPEQTLRVTKNPADEAFFAGDNGAQEPARRVRMGLKQPARGEIGSDWDGSFTIETDPPEADKDWKIDLTLVDGNTQFRCGKGEKDENDPACLKVHVKEEDRNELQRRLAGKVAGETLTLQASVGRDAASRGFSQLLSFPLRIADDKGLPLPLQPAFIHFEDPEYNRRLASSAVQVDGVLKVGTGTEKVAHGVTLATDRREYNPDSRVAFRYDWAGTRPAGATGALAVKQLNAAGDEISLTLPSQPGKVAAPEPGTLYQFSLLELTESDETPATLSPGDALELKLTIQTKNDDGQVDLFLTINIVAAPVIPVPEAAYALLRWQEGTNTAGETETQVECVRFAWSPEASRVELVCAEDLRTGVVRRRAVFQWRDSVRPATVGGYALQKITQSGSTHLPEREPWPEPEVV